MENLESLVKAKMEAFAKSLTPRLATLWKMLDPPLEEQISIWVEDWGQDVVPPPGAEQDALVLACTTNVVSNLSFHLSLDELGTPRLRAHIKVKEDFNKAFAAWVAATS